MKLLVQLSLDKALATTDRTAATFYRRLFEIDPSVRPLFKTDLEEQEQKFTSTLKVLVEGLDDLERVLPEVRNLGKRHVLYGVKDHHYDTVGTALLWTLEEEIGATFTPDVRSAWSDFYNLVAQTMKEAAAEC